MEIAMKILVLLFALLPSIVLGNTNNVTIESVNVDSGVKLNFRLLKNGMVDVFASRECTYLYNPDVTNYDFPDCSIEYSPRVFISKEDEGKLFVIEETFIYVQFRLNSFVSNFSIAF